MKTAQGPKKPDQASVRHRTGSGPGNKTLPLEAGARSFVLALLLLTGTTYLDAQPLPGWQQPTSPDTTKSNQSTGVTADQQKNNSPDIRVTRRIRRAIFEDKSLSTDAHNIKIITRDGAVTLKGPVQSEREKENVESKASEVVGQANVVSKIRVAPKQPGS